MNPLVVPPGLNVVSPALVMDSSSLHWLRQEGGSSLSDFSSPVFRCSLQAGEHPIKSRRSLPLQWSTLAVVGSEAILSPCTTSPTLAAEQPSSSVLGGYQRYR
ncbi:hypothetical protein SKAU_G00369590 [Synaphobranchus kaupii]|uniref:Uncharacterized protein n=1 Tax=Synaphobranchus kaupii TaxID=118154 RepID=A0A9Q1IDP9_SYNKA|nr:hypothetical protein SKAU_G00369590 [Synaphobranchus kaupii]